MAADMRLATAAATLTSSILRPTSFSGSGTLSADLTSFSDSYNSAGRAMIMMRANNTPGAVYAAVMEEPGGTVNFYWRTAENTATQHYTLTNSTLGYLELIRTGQSFSGYFSTNGTSWTQIGSAVTLSEMPGTVLAGLAVGSHADPDIATATFTHVTLTPGFTDSDIGSPADAGSASFDSFTNTYTVKGGGADIWNASDQFNYDYQSLAGDGTIVARVDSVTDTNAWTKAGVMFRNDTTAGAANVAVLVTPGNGVTFQWRTTAGGSSSNVAVAGLEAVQWVKLVRAGSNFTAYYSLDGVNWTQIGSAETVTLGTTALAGLAVTAHDNTQLATATFDHVSINPSLALEATPMASSSLTTARVGNRGRQ